MVGPVSLIRDVLRRERAILALCIAVLCVLAWAYILSGAGMSGHEDMRMEASMAHMSSQHADIPPVSFALVLGMWWWMMVAMMLPSAAPAILLYDRVHQSARAREAARSTAPAAVFVAGYLLCWLGFSVAAALGQRWLASEGLISPELYRLTSRWGSGLVLVAAGLYQLTPLKGACLSHCRSPADYLAKHWRPGWRGALLLGVRHGAYCVGCCWALMLLLFVGGVMNLLLIAVLTLFVIAEKLMPYGPIVGRLSGILLLALGVMSLVLVATG
jgi:predicted metal-binding membrane protein